MGFVLDDLDLLIMNWTKDTVEEKLGRNSACKQFVENGGYLRLYVCDVSLLFFANCDDTVSVYFEYIPSHNADISYAKEFCKYAIPYLTRYLSNRSKDTIMTSYCIHPIRIDM